MPSPFFNRNKAAALVALAARRRSHGRHGARCTVRRQDGPLGRLQEQADGSVRVDIYEPSAWHAGSIPAGAH